MTLPDLTLRRLLKNFDMSARSMARWIVHENSRYTSYVIKVKCFLQIIKPRNLIDVVCSRMVIFDLSFMRDFFIFDTQMNRRKGS